ncbi:MAG TPA: VOC family protein [Pseudonocardiaceae bacterium]
MRFAMQNVAFDCANAYELATFWSKVMEWPLDDEDAPGVPEAVAIAPDGGTNLYFNEVPEPKAGKNRVHVCLRPSGHRDAELERLLGLGATMVADLREGDHTSWAVLADPEGNEFCLLRGDADRAGQG